MRRVTISDVPQIRGVNFYGLGKQLPGPTEDELRALPGNAVRTFVGPRTDLDQVKQLLAAADRAGKWVLVSRDYDSTVTAADHAGWLQRCTDDLSLFSAWPSYVPADMNEPLQTSADWEIISRDRVNALRAAGWTGVIGVSSAGASTAAGINKLHPAGWWINDPGAFLETHHYLEGLKDSRPSQTKADLDAYAVTRGRKDYADFIRWSFPFGLLGTAKWASVPKVIGEFALPHGMETELTLIWDLYSQSRVGALQWAAGRWTNDYPWAVNASELATLATRSSGVPMTLTLSYDQSTKQLTGKSDSRKHAAVPAKTVDVSVVVTDPGTGAVLDTGTATGLVVDAARSAYNDAIAAKTSDGTKITQVSDDGSTTVWKIG